MKKLIAMLLAMVKVLGLVACAAKTEPPAADTKTEAPAAGGENICRTFGRNTAHCPRVSRAFAVPTSMSSHPFCRYRKWKSRRPFERRIV